MRLSAIVCAAGLFAAASFAAPAAAEPYTLDKSHAHITFTVSHLGFSLVHGQFREFDAEIDFDPDAVETSSVKFTIDAASIDTFWEKRDEHIRGADFLDVENHPAITFESTAIELTSAETAKVTGDLTIRGETQEQVFDAQLNKIGPSPFEKDKTIAGFTVTGEIDRTRFGVSYGAPAIGGTIPVRIDLEMSPAS